MRDTEKILYNVTGQQISLIVLQGRPSAATVKVFKALASDDSTEEFAVDPATIDSVDTTVNGEAGRSEADPNSIPLASVTGIKTGRFYRLSQNGMMEWVEPVEIDEATPAIRTRLPLQNDYSNGAALESTYLFADVPDAFAQDADKLGHQAELKPHYRARWEVTLPGGKVIDYGFFRLVRVAGDAGVTIADLETKWPGLLESLPERLRPDQGQSLIDDIHRDARAELRTIGLSEAAIRDTDALRRLTVVMARRALVEMGMAPPNWEPPEYLEQVARPAVEEMLDSLKESRVGMDTGRDGGSSAPPEEPWV